MPRLEFTAGEVLQAADMNTISDQTVMTFAGTAARGSAIPSPTEGMVTYLEDADELQVYTTDWGGVGGGKILQVVSTTKTDTFTMASTSFADVTGLSATMTPTATSSKIFVSVAMNVGAQPGTVALQAKLLRDATDIAVGDAAGSRTRASAAGLPVSGDQTAIAINHLDSPATTSSVTYKMQIRGNTANTVSVNRSVTDSDAVTVPRTVSSITIMEVAG